MAERNEKRTKKKKQRCPSRLCLHFSPSFVSFGSIVLLSCREDTMFPIHVNKREPDATPFFLMWVDNAELMQAVVREL
jgi:hypothetical protein